MQWQPSRTASRQLYLYILFIIYFVLFNLSLFSDKKWNLQKLITTMIYKNYIYIFNWKTKTKKCKISFRERIKSKVVTIWFTYLFVNIDTQIKIDIWSKPLVYILSEFIEVSFWFYVLWEWIQIWGAKILKLLSTYFAVLWTFTFILFGLCVTHFVLWNISSTTAGFRLLRVLKTSNPSVLKIFTFIVHLPDLSRRNL